MEEFRLLPPVTRQNMTEWVGHALEDKEGLTSLRYFFVELNLNGDDLGVYAIEEHFNKELLENRKAREGIIFSAKVGYLNDNQESVGFFSTTLYPIKIFNEKKIITNNHIDILFFIFFTDNCRKIAWDCNARRAQVRFRFFTS